jgi:hypothetical protein
MRPARSRVLALVASLTIALATAAHADGPDSCSALSGTPTAFDADDTRMTREEARFVEQLFDLARAVAADNAGVLRWLVSDRREGVHADDHRARVDAHLRVLDAFVTPERLAPVRALVREAIETQRSFFGDWAEALAEGVPFESQLTSEFGWHDGVYGAERALLRAYSKLLALDPAEPERNRRAFHAELCGLARFRVAR